MKSKSVYKTICRLLCCCVLASLVLVNETKADGTEQLGLPSIPIALGSHILVEGTGLKDAQPGDISIEIPADATIVQVLLYWTGRSINIDPGNEDTIQVNGMDVTGPRIGGPTPALDITSNTYRADISEIGFSESWILSGQTNVLSVSGLDFSHQNDGAAVVVILDDGSMADIQIMDGNDFAYLPLGLQTEPVDFLFAPSADPRLATLQLIVTDIDVPRPAAVDITVDGVTTRLDDVLQDNEGDLLDVIELEVAVPAGVTNVTVQVLSIDDDSDLNPASLAWTFVAWKLPEPYTPPQGCTYTIGFWKNHPYDWPTDNLSLYTGHEAMMILWTPPKKGNAYIILAHQYIGAELNMLNGTSVPDEALEAWLSAQELLEQYQNEESIPKKSSDRDLAIDLASILDDYNNGIIGPGHCD